MSLLKKKIFIASNIVFLGLFLFSAIMSTAEAVTWEKLIDYGHTGYSETSNNWKTYNSPESVNGSYRYLSREAGNHSRTGTATWQTEIPYCGTYSVRVSCRKTENRTSDADYYVTDSNNELAHFSINQIDHRNILDWDLLGVYYYEKGQVVLVKLDGTDDGASDCADATKWELVELKRCSGEAPTLPPINSLLLKK